VSKLVKLFRHIKNDGIFRTFALVRRYFCRKITDVFQSKITRLKLLAFIDDSVIELLKQKSVFAYLEDTCVDHMDDEFPHSGKSSGLAGQKPIIWIFWLQGMDAPPPHCTRM
jgi:hypothetical protein